MFLEVVAIIVALVMLFKFVIVPQKPESYANNDFGIPGMAPSDPVEGNKQDIKMSSMSVFLQQLHKKYGPVASFWEGKNLAVSLASSDLLKDIRHLYETPNHAFEQFLVLTGPEIFSMQEVDEIKRRRKLYDHHFMKQACTSYANCFVEVAEDALKKWKKLGSEEEIPLSETMSFYSLAALARTSFGDYFKNEDNIKEYLELITFVFQNLDPPPPPDVQKQVEEKCDRMRDIILKILEERRQQKKNGGEDERQLFIDVLLDDDFTDNERVADSSVFIGAGYITTALMMTWAIYELARHPDMQEKVHQEIVNELGDQPVTLETIPKLLYLRQVLDETLRLYLRYLYGARTADDNTVVGGYKVPKGTTIYQAVGIVFVDPNIFPDPLNFDPDRFTSENSRGRHAYAYKPFGYAGKRVCPGQVFALTEMTIFMAQWLRSLRFKLVSEEHVKLAENITMLPEKEIIVTVEIRK